MSRVQKLRRFIATVVFLDCIFTAVYLSVSFLTSQPFDVDLLITQMWGFFHSPTQHILSDLLYAGNDMHFRLSAFSWAIYIVGCLAQTALLAFVGGAIYLRLSQKEESNVPRPH